MVFSEQRAHQPGEVGNMQLTVGKVARGSRLAYHVPDTELL